MKRSDEKEWMDLGHYTPEEYEETLYQLDLVGRYLGGNRATFSALKSPPQSILDLGCGGGFFTQILAKRYPNAQVVGFDISEEAIQFAKRHQAPNLHFTTSTSETFDLITATLVCHHMSDAELIQFLKDSSSQAKTVILNDLHRCWLAYLGFWGISSCFFNGMVKHDGLLSIRRGFTRREWESLLKAAGIRNYSISWHWPFRWIVLIKNG